MTMYKDLTPEEKKAKVDYVRKSYAKRREVFRKDMPWKLTYKSVRAGARKRGIKFSITESYLQSIWTDVCPILGIPLVANKDRYSDNSFSVDRIDNSKGYVEGNVAVISNKANKLKNNGTLSEFKALVEYLENR